MASTSAEDPEVDDVGLVHAFINATNEFHVQKIISNQPKVNESLTCGLLMKLRSSLLRALDSFPNKHHLEKIPPQWIFYLLVAWYTDRNPEILQSWTPPSLLEEATRISRKVVGLSEDEKCSVLALDAVNPCPEHFLDEQILDALHPEKCRHCIDYYELLLSPSSFLKRDSNISDFRFQDRHPLTCGLVVKLRNGMYRVVRRSRMKAPLDARGYEDRLYFLVRHFTTDVAQLEMHWTPSTLMAATVELASKIVCLSPQLEKILYDTPLDSVRNSSDGIGSGSDGDEDAPRLQFSPEFLRMVAAYHRQVQRPEGTFREPQEQLADVAQAALLARLEALDREECPSCGCRRQVYCGTCEGVRMPLAGALLPPRVDLPFDVLVMLHWHETLHKCTGVHLGVLSSQGGVEFQEWPKDKSRPARKGDASSGSAWEHLITSLDSTRDVILFPSPLATPAEHFPWTSRQHLRTPCGSLQAADTGRHCSDGSDSGDATEPNRITTTGIGECTIDDGDNNQVGEEQSDGDLFDNFLGLNDIEDFQPSSTANHVKGTDVVPSGDSGKWRLVLLEASWAHGKTMEMQIRELRAERGLAPLPLVTLQGVTGEYWRFHTEGHSAVSSIEAVTHAARAAGATHEVCEALLLLFRLQKHRVLRSVKEGGKVPKAINVAGNGIGSWKHLTDSLPSLDPT